MVVSGTGEVQKKGQYLTALRSGKFVHNDIAIEENRAAVESNTATVVGKGRFTVNISGDKISLHLSYMEVFTIVNKRWNYLRFILVYSPFNVADFKYISRFQTFKRSET